jgi:hypothetical protein
MIPILTRLKVKVFLRGHSVKLSGLDSCARDCQPLLFDVEARLELEDEAMNHGGPG